MDVAAGDAGFRNATSSPVPYLFGGLSLMLVLMAFALTILACSSHRNSSLSTSDGNNNNEEKSTKNVEMDEVDNLEPKIVVIMAGDSNPTYLAKPVSQSTCHTQEAV